MESLLAFIPEDRRLALAAGRELPDRASGSVLFADISGFTPLTAALAQELGVQRGAEEVLNQINPCLLYTSPSPRDRTRSRMPSSA